MSLPVRKVPWALHASESVSSQTASRSVQPFYTAHPCTQHMARHADHAACDTPLASTQCVRSMWPKTLQKVEKATIRAVYVSKVFWRLHRVQVDVWAMQAFANHVGHLFDVQRKQYCWSDLLTCMSTGAVYYTYCIALHCYTGSAEAIATWNIIWQTDLAYIGAASLRRRISWVTWGETVTFEIQRRLVF